MCEYVFGPVLSSRLGKSLGVDLLGKNICSFDCLYCESGKTQIKTVKRAEYVTLERIIRELEEWFALGHEIPDHITLGGPGEPLLNARIGEIICSIKESWPEIPLAVLTNSSLLGSRKVREQLRYADTVLPSLDSMVEEEFFRINRPHSQIRLRDIVRGIMDFKSSFEGRLCLEIMIIPGINDSDENLKLVKDFCFELNPYRVDVTSMTRPGAYLDAAGMDASLPEKWRTEFEPFSVDKPYKKSVKRKFRHHKLRSMIASSVQRRPQTSLQLSQALEVNQDDLTDMLKQMEQAKEIEPVKDSGNNKIFYKKRGKNAS